MFKTTQPTLQPRLNLELITPEKARRYIAKNTNNRQVKAANVLKVKNDLLNDNYKLTHQGIAFDWNGNLVDGQHRLLAVIESNVSVQMFVGYDFDPEIFKILDCGSSRTSADALKHAGATNYSVVAAGIRLILWAHTRYEAQLSPNTVKLYKTYTTTNAETAKFYEESSEVFYTLGQRVTRLRQVNSNILQSACLAFLYLANEKYPDDDTAYDFMARIASGANLSPGSVELAMAKFIAIKNVELHNYKKGEYMLSAFIKAYNRYLRGDQIIQFRVGNVEPLPFITAV